MDDIFTIRPKPRSHLSEGEPNRVEGGRKIHGKRVVPSSDGHLLDGTELPHDSVVHDDIEPPELTARLPNEVLDIRRAREIGAVENSAHSMRSLHLPPRSLGLLGRREPVQDDVTALGGQAI